MNKCSARRALPDNDKKKVQVFRNTPTEHIKLKTPDSGQTPDSGHACPLGGRASFHTVIL